MIRKIIQILTVNDRLIALCEDGSMWQRDLLAESVEYFDKEGIKHAKLVYPWINLEGVPDAPEQSKIQIKPVPNPTNGKKI